MMCILHIFGGYCSEQGLFDSQRGFAGSNTYPVADPEDMGIYRNGGLPKMGVEDDIGGFPPDTGERFQGLPICGHRTAMQGQQLLGQGMHMTGFGVKQPQTTDMGLNAVLTERYHGVWSGCCCKECLRTGVDDLVCTLRGEHYGDQKLKRGVVVQLCFGVGDGGTQCRKAAMNLIWIHDVLPTEAEDGTGRYAACGAGAQVCDLARHRWLTFRRGDNDRSLALPGGDGSPQRHWLPRPILHDRVPGRGACRGPVWAGCYP